MCSRLLNAEEVLVCIFLTKGDPGQKARDDFTNFTRIYSLISFITLHHDNGDVGYQRLVLNVLDAFLDADNDELAGCLGHYRNPKTKYLLYGISLNVFNDHLSGLQYAAVPSVMTNI